MTERPHLLVVRLRSDDPSAGSRTTASLLEQTWADWSFVELDAAREPWLTPLPDVLPVPDDAGRAAVLTLADGDELVPDALERIATAFSPDTRLVSWDSRDPSGAPLLRPSWSPDTLLSEDYLRGVVAIEIPTLEAARSALPAEARGSLWGALIGLDLSLEECAHLAVELTVLRPRTSTDEERAAVVSAGLVARGWPAQALVERTASGRSRVRLEWQPETWPTVTVVIPSRHNTALLEPCLRSLARTTGPSFSVVMVDNGERTPENEAWYARDWGFPLRVLWWDEPFNYSRVNNVAVRSTDTDVVVLLNDDTEVRDPGWLAEVVGLASRPEIGCVGLQLIDAQGRIQHTGVWMGLGGFAGHLFAAMQPGDDTIFGSTSWYRNTLAVTGACLGVRRDLYLALAGMDEDLVLCGSDVVLGLDAVARGLRNVCSPLDGVSHLESATRSGAPIGDQVLSMELYRHWHDVGDPYLSPRLSLRAAQPRLRRPGETSPVSEARARLGSAPTEGSPR